MEIEIGMGFLPKRGFRVARLKFAIGFSTKFCFRGRAIESERGMEKTFAFNEIQDERER